MPKNRYLDDLQAALNRAIPRLTATDRLEYKNVFGAIGAYVDGRIFMSCGKFGIAVKLPPEVLGDLFAEDGVSRLRYFPKGHIKRDYAVIPPRIVHNRQRFRQLVERSIAFCSVTLSDP